MTVLQVTPTEYQPTSGYNKLIVNGETKFDLTNDNIQPGVVSSGKTFHMSDGVQSIGTWMALHSQEETKRFSGGLEFDGLNINSINMFYITAEYSASTLSVNSTKQILSISYDGHTTRMLYTWYSNSKANVMTSTSVSFSLSNGKLTVNNSLSNVYFITDNTVSYVLYYV